MRGGPNTLVKPFHNDQPIRKLWENYPEICPILKKHCELMRAKLPHHMPRNLTCRIAKGGAGSPHPSGWG